MIVVDPVRTATAAKADEWLPITPGTDAALLMAVVHTLFDEDLATLGPLADHVDRVDALRDAARDWSPERVAPVTGIEADRIRQLARQLAGTERAVVYGRIGLCNQEFGSLASWLVDVVNILTGHFDTPAARCSPPGGLDHHRPAAAGPGGRAGRVRPLAPGCAAPGGPRPGAGVLPRRGDRDPGEGQIRALITVAGNPVLSTPAGHRLDRCCRSSTR